MNPAFTETLYLPLLCGMLTEIEREESPAIARAARQVYEAFQRGGVLHVFATGHSHMIADELFFRAGGLAPINPLLSPEMMVYEGAQSATQYERQEGNAAKLLSGHDLRPTDVLLLSSNSGINVAPVEAALLAKEKGLFVVGITCQKASRELPPRHPSGQKLYQVCDLVIDNHAPPGDGLLRVPPENQPTGSASTFGSLLIAQRLVLAVERLYLEHGQQPPIFKSANTPGGDAYNRVLVEKYSPRIPALAR